MFSLVKKQKKSKLFNELIAFLKTAYHSAKNQVTPMKTTLTLKKLPQIVICLGMNLKKKWSLNYNNVKSYK